MRLTLRGHAAREPAKERTEHKPRLRCKGDIGGQADDNAERQAQHGSKPDGGSDAHGRESMVAALNPRSGEQAAAGVATSGQPDQADPDGGNVEGVDGRDRDEPRGTERGVSTYTLE